jgi:CHAD domain-containing protein
MAFRLRHEDKSVPHGLRRLARKQLRSALDELHRRDGAADEAIHNARTRVKKVRALLHVVEADRGRHLSDSKKLLRAVNRRLSKLRDADATLEVFDKIRAGTPHLMSEHAFARVRRMLTRDKHATVQKARRERSREKAAIAIRAVYKAAKQWRQRHDGFGALAAGIRASHRDGSAAMERALKSREPGDFHTWRKQIKALWYELRLLEGCDRTIHKDVRSLDRAETMLGDGHNIVVMCDRLFGDAAPKTNADLDRLRRAAERYHRNLQRKAVASARGIYTLPSREYVRRVKKAWKRWRRGPGSGARGSPHRTAA